MIRLGVGLPAYKGLVCSAHPKMWMQFGSAINKNSPLVRLEAFFDVDICGIDHARNAILDTCRAGELDWALMVDSDTWVDHGRSLLTMILDADAADATMVGCPVVMKDERQANVFRYNEEGRLRPSSSIGGLFEVDGIGGAIIAVNLKKSGKAHFKFTDRTGEDLEFCHQVRQGGGKILCDSRIKTLHVSKPDILVHEPLCGIMREQRKEVNR